MPSTPALMARCMSTGVRTPHARTFSPSFFPFANQIRCQRISRRTELDDAGVENALYASRADVRCEKTDVGSGFLPSDPLDGGEVKRGEGDGTQ